MKLRVQNPSIFALAQLDLQTQTAMVRKGLPFSAFIEMSDTLDMPLASLLDQLQLSNGLSVKRLKSKPYLNLAVGNAVLCVIKALAKAIEVFEDQEAAVLWMKRKTRTLGGTNPISLMDTQCGYELVLQALGRIQQGVVA